MMNWKEWVDLILFGRLRETENNIDEYSQYRIGTRIPYLPSEY
jgi:hypothetical protein